MAATEIYSHNWLRNSRGLMNVLSVVACEWLLIFLLFVDAAFSHLLTKFALYCELPAPCVLCSRLDHFFGNDKSGCYQTLLCSEHRADISSLITCHIHGKLADARRMCDECFMSFSIRSISNSESYKVGKLELEFKEVGFQNPIMNENFIPDSSSSMTCLCCNKQQRARSNASRLPLPTPAGCGASRANVKPQVPGHCHCRLSHRAGLKKLKILGSTTHCQADSDSVDHLSHVGYTELNVTSNSESEVPYSDDGDERSTIREKFIARRGRGIVPKPRTDIVVLAKEHHQASEEWPSLLDQHVQLAASESSDSKSLAFDIHNAHRLGELNTEQHNKKSKTSVLPELISLDDIPTPSNIVEVFSGTSLEKSKPNVLASHMSSLSVLSELLSLNSVTPASSVVGGSNGVPPKKFASYSSTTKQAEPSNSSENTTGIGISDASAPPMSNDINLGDIRELESTSKGRDELGMLVDSSKINEVQDALQQKICNQDSNLSPSHLNPRAYHHDDLQNTNASSSYGSQELQRSNSIERNDSGSDSHDDDDVTNIEGESVVQRLKRQVTHGRIRSRSLYKELEEERNAAAIAANQAMAMITRLQEEKAALHMEALQYLRMMEEQAEYDMEALEKANDLLAEKEKEMQDLEAELDLYRNNMTDESFLQALEEEIPKSKVKEVTIEMSHGEPCIEKNVHTSPDKDKPFDEKILPLDSAKYKANENDASIHSVLKAAEIPEEID